MFWRRSAAPASISKKNPEAVQYFEASDETSSQAALARLVGSCESAPSATVRVVLSEVDNDRIRGLSSDLERR